MEYPKNTIYMKVHELNKKEMEQFDAFSQRVLREEKEGDDGWKRKKEGTCC
jgi:hypothetical protein